MNDILTLEAENSQELNWYVLRSIMNQSSAMTGNTTYYMAICNVKIGLQMYQEGQIDMESWKTPMMKNVQIRKYKMSNLTM